MTEWNVGDRIARRWEVERILRGGMGVVYVVYDHEWGEAFAVKTFQDRTLQSGAVAAAFRKEALAWVRLGTHPNVAQARMLHEVEGQPLLFLEYLTGGDLSWWVGTPRLTDDPAQVLRFSLQLCDGMTHAFGHGVLAHRDLKPANCLLTAEGTLKVTDFGLAKAMDTAFEAGLTAGRTIPPVTDGASDLTLAYDRSTGASVTRTGIAGGTPPYMSPEQFEDLKRADVRSDIYSFGIMLFEMITGRLPFEGRTVQHWYQLHSGGVRAALPARFAALEPMLARCVAKRPGDRYASFEDVRGELSEVFPALAGAEAPPPPSARDYSVAELHNKGLSLFALKRHQEALLFFERCLATDPDLSTAWTSKGVALGAGLGDWAAALPCFERALAIDPESADAMSGKGQALRARGDSEGALACYDRAMALKPHADRIRSNRAVALLTVGRAEAALAESARALELNPRSAEAWSNRALILGEGMRRWAEAIEAFDRALEIDAGNEIVWLNRGGALLSSGRPAEALEAADQALTIRRFENALLLKAAALGALGRGTEALIACDRALELNPSYVKAWINKGNALQRLDRHEEAIACYDEAIDLDPKSAGAHFNRGSALIGCERLTQALHAFTEAERLGHPRAAEIIARLNS